MAQNTKGDIIACARRLFEAQGYNGVSMRDIAKELGISVGNLTYHFKKKEALIEAILLAPEINQQKPPAPQTLAELQAYFLHSLEVQQAYAFYFDSYHQLAQTSPTLAQIQQKMLGETTADLDQAFAHFQAKGLMCPEAYPGQYQALVRAVTVLLMVRLPGEERRIAGTNGIRSVLERLRSILSPFLTETGTSRWSLCCNPVEP